MASPEEHAAAADPRTDLTELARLAHEHPDLRPAVAGNPSAYEGLLQWLAGIGDPAVNAALAARGAVPVVATTVGWHEPARDVPLQWGTYEMRYGLGLGLLLAAIAVPWAFIAYATMDYEEVRIAIVTYITPGLLAIAGAAVSPAPLGRRIGAAGVVAGTALLDLLSGSLFGFFGYFTLISFIAAPLIVWLMLRMRAGLAYLLVIAAVLLTFGYILLPFDNGFSGFALDSVAKVALVAGLAWAARAIHIKRAPLLAQRTLQKPVYTGYAYAQPGGPVMSHPGAPTNTTAVLALVFGIGGGLLGIILGHIARSQIRRTGEGGWALATVGLVFGYIGLGAGVVLGIVYVVMLTR